MKFENKSLNLCVRKKGLETRSLKQGQRRKITRLRARIACYLSREMGISMVEIGRKVGAGTLAIAMAIKHEEANSKF